MHVSLRPRDTQACCMGDPYAGSRWLTVACDLPKLIADFEMSAPRLPKTSGPRLIYSLSPALTRTPQHLTM
jgi:hypothetical protein